MLLNTLKDVFTRADDFVETIGVLYGNSKNVLKNRLASFIQFPHKCMYDTLTLLKILSETGFEAAIRTAFNSDISDIQLVELQERTENAAIAEGRKR